MLSVRLPEKLPESETSMLHKSVRELSFIQRRIAFAATLSSSLMLETVSAAPAPIVPESEMPVALSVSVWRAGAAEATVICSN